MEVGGPEVVMVVIVVLVVVLLVVSVMVVISLVILIRQIKKTHSAQTNMASELRKLESCGCARLKADEKISIFVF